MPTRVRSYSKINLGLAIGPPRPDGFHALTTLYQTLALHDLVTVSARRAAAMSIVLQSNNPRVPLDQRNTAWKMVERTLAARGIHAEVTIQIDKRLPIQGGMGAGSANAASALIGLERELELDPAAADRLEIAAQVGSDVPLFLLGGAVFGLDRGQKVSAAPDLTLEARSEIPCVIALPNVGVSTPQAFRDWDRRWAQSDANLHLVQIRDTMVELSRTYASVFPREFEQALKAHRSGASGILFDPSLEQKQGSPENLQGTSSEQLHTATAARSGFEDDLAENSLLALVRTGIENDFEQVVFLQYPFLREIKRHLMGDSDAGDSAVYAALSGSGSALFGLYRSTADADAAQQRLEGHGVRALVTKTMPRQSYASRMFAE